MNIKLKKAAVLIGLIFALTVFGSAVFEAVHAGHDCCGEGCAVCAQLSACEEMLSGGAVPAGALTVLVIAAAAVYAARPRRADIRTATLISLKVMLLD